MPALQIIALDTATPQLRAPATGDTYLAPRAIAITPEALTGSAAGSSLDIAQTWNTTGTPTALKLNVTDTASNAASLLMDLQVGGSSRLSLAKTGTLAVRMITGDWSTGEPTIKFVPDSGIPMGLEVAQGGSALMIKASNNRSGMVFRESSVDMRSDGRIRWTNATNPLTTSDLVLTRDAAGTLAQVNGTNAQTFRIYNTTDSGITNYERGFVGWASNTLRIGTEKGGTGTARALEFQTDGVTRLTIATGGGATFSGTLESVSVKTGAPAGGTSGTWKLGVAATVSPTSPNRTIEVDIGGTIYYIAAKTTND